MLTDEEADRISAEHKAKPGTPADITVCVDPRRGRDALVSACDRLKQQGYRWFRVTNHPDGRVYLEGWREPPEVEGELNTSAAGANDATP
jgi:hypothetical protein